MDFRDYESTDLEGAAHFERENSFPDDLPTIAECQDDDRAYNHSIDDPSIAGWYPDWDGPARNQFLGELPDPDFGAMEDLKAHLISTGEGSMAPDDCEWLPEFDPDDLPF